MKLIRIIIVQLLAALFILSIGCANPGIQPSAKPIGETATIDDSFQTLSRSKANFFYVQKIDDKEIANALTTTSAASAGMGSQLLARGESRSIPAKPLSLYLIGQTYHVAPIGRIFGSAKQYLVEGEIEFAPEANQKYLVKGILGEEYSAVWIEDLAGNKVSSTVKTGTPKSVPDEASIAAIHRETNMTKQQLFLGIASGESIDLVKAKIGEPTKVSHYSGNFMLEKQPHVTYEYEGLGIIQFSSRNSQPEFVQKVMPITEKDMDIGSISEKVTNSSGSTLQHIAKGYYGMNIQDIEALDIFARKIWMERNTTDPYTADAAAWLVKILAKGGNARYKSLLQKLVDDSSTNPKLHRYAKDTLKLIPSESLEQFVP